MHERQSADPTRRGFIPVLPPGSIMPFAGFTIPPGWLPCDGSAPLIIDFPELFVALSISQGGVFAFGSGVVTGLVSTSQMQPGMRIYQASTGAFGTILSVDSPTQITSTNLSGFTGPDTLIVAPWGMSVPLQRFTTPDLQGRVVVGAGAGAGLTLRVLGASAGEEAITLAAMPNHAHGFTAFDAGLVPHGHLSAPASSNVAGVPVPDTGFSDETTLAAGGSGADGNMQPFAACQWIIKA